MFEIMDKKELNYNIKKNYIILLKELYYIVLYVCLFYMF